MKHQDCIGKNVLIIFNVTCCKEEVRDFLTKDETPLEGVITAVSDCGKFFRFNGTWRRIDHWNILQEIAARPEPAKKKRATRKRRLT
jgi:hypothetical protein